MGRYDLLPFDLAMMEWVPTRLGVIPVGRRAIDGGYEEDGSRLYHGLAIIDGIKVPGKCAEHLVSLHLLFCLASNTRAAWVQRRFWR